MYTNEIHLQRHEIILHCAMAKKTQFTQVHTHSFTQVHSWNIQNVEVNEWAIE